MKTSYLDLYLIHAPYGFAEDTAELFPCDASNMILGSKVDYLETWAAMEKLVERGLGNFKIMNSGINDVQSLL